MEFSHATNFRFRQVFLLYTYTRHCTAWRPRVILYHLRLERTSVAAWRQQARQHTAFMGIDSETKENIKKKPKITRTAFPPTKVIMKTIQRNHSVAPIYTQKSYKKGHVNHTGATPHHRDSCSRYLPSVAKETPRFYAAQNFTEVFTKSRHRPVQ